MEVTDIFLRREQMIPARAPPTALGTASSSAIPAVPADPSNPGRIIEYISEQEQAGQKATQQSHNCSADFSQPQRQERHSPNDEQAEDCQLGEPHDVILAPDCRESDANKTRK